MKKIFFILLTSLIINRIYSQEYSPLLGNTNTWYVLHSSLSTFTDIYSLKGDTLINERCYKVFGYREYDNVFGFLREDSISKKVFVIPNSKKDTSEIIYYDFNLDENDSIYLISLDYDSLGYYKVDSIRNVNTLMGLRKAFYLKGNRKYSEASNYFSYDYPVWIEGIGTIGNPEFREETPNEWNYGKLNCFFKNDEKLYQSEQSIELNDCDIYIDNVDDFKLSTEIKIFPNPAYNSITIDIPDNEKFLLYVYDIFGQKLIQLDSPDIVTFDSFAKGTYFLKFKIHGVYITKKLLIIK